LPFENYHLKISLLAIPFFVLHVMAAGTLSNHLVVFHITNRGHTLHGALTLEVDSVWCHESKYKADINSSLSCILACPFLPQ